MQHHRSFTRLALTIAALAMLNCSELPAEEGSEIDDPIAQPAAVDPLDSEVPDTDPAGAEPEGGEAEVGEGEGGEGQPEPQADTGGCSRRQDWGAFSAQACVSSQGRSLATSTAWVSYRPGCTSCQYRWVLQLKQDISLGIDPVVKEKISPGTAGAKVISIDNHRVRRGKYYSFLRLEAKLEGNWIRLQTVESPRVDVR